MKLREMQILSVGYLLISVFPSPGNFSLCLVYNATAHPCPGCGMTRALHHILSGNLYGALLFHPVSFALLPVLLFFVLSIVIAPLATFYNDRKRLFNAGIGGGALVILGYGVLRWYIEAGAWPELSPYFANFNEPVLIRPLYESFFH